MSDNNHINIHSEPRKIVLILGNGFDLDLGYKTSYKDFWESEYCPKDYPAPLIHHLNQKWNNVLEAVKWYDLENEFLYYYRSIPDPIKGMDHITDEEKALLKDFDCFGFTFGKYDDKLDIVKSLVDKGVLLYRHPGYIDDNYIKDALQPPIWRDRKAFQLIKDGLCNYLRTIDSQAKRDNSMALQVLFAANCAREADAFLNIYSFNYTKLPVYYGNGFESIIHYVHGNCEKGKIIIGTKDDEYVKSYDFLMKSFDSQFNAPPIVSDLLEADEVIIFGHSIGENDRQYFEAFFRQQTDVTHPKKKDIIIFTKDEESKVDIKRSLQKMTGNNLSTLYCLNHIEIIKTSDFKEDRDSLVKFFSDHIADNMHLLATLHRLDLEMA